MHARVTVYLAEKLALTCWMHRALEISEANASYGMFRELSEALASPAYMVATPMLALHWSF